MELKWFVTVAAIIHHTSGQPPSHLVLFAEGMRAFAGNMYYHTLRSNQSVNYIYSPLR